MSFFCILYFINTKTHVMKSVVKTLTLIFLFNFLSVTAQDNSNEITIYWDTSLSMLDKNITKEIELLNNYFINKKNVKVSLVSFSNKSKKPKEYNIVNSDWSNLKNDLLSSKYDGATFYKSLKFDLNSDVNLFFTDGLTTLDELDIPKNIPTYFITSTENKNFQLLIKKGFGSKGGYIDLTSDSTKEALESLKVKNIKEIIKEKAILTSDKSSKFKKGLIKGRVYNNKGMLSGAEVYVNNKKLKTRSNKQGEFAIKTKLGDVLKVKHSGKYSLSVEVNDFKPKDFYFPEEENVLEEVNIKAGKKTKEETITTSYGKIDKKKVGYAVKTISNEEINSANANNISDAVRGKMGAAKLNNNGDISTAVFRAGESFLSNNYPLIVIDGLPMKRNSSVKGTSTNSLTNYIDPSNVANLTILKGMAATNKYGSEGVNGVILITTKTALAGVARKKRVNTALAKNNDYKEENLTLVKDDGTSYLKGFKETKSSLEAYKLYLEQRKKYINNIEYYVTVSDYLSQWNSKELALKVFSSALEISTDNVRNLKFLAFKAEEKRMLNISELALKRVLILKPKEAQAYRDLALIYVKQKKYQKALNLYAAILNKTNSNVNFSGLNKILNSEVSKLIFLHGNKLDKLKLPEKYHTVKELNIDARIVFDWNYSDAEFELQFVNPQKKFFKWSHTLSESSKRISEEKLTGFYSEEFLLVDVEKGEWIINVENKSSSSIKPIAIKYSVFKNYGKTNETEEVRTLLLSGLKGKKMLGRIKIE